MKQVRIIFAAVIFFLTGVLLTSAWAVLATKREVPEFLETGKWIRSEPLRMKDLKGKVVLIHFWSFASAPSLRDLVYLDEWRFRYNDYGLQIIGVHSPHYPFEFSETALENHVMDLGIFYPIVHDPNLALWRSFNNLEKPAMYLVDALGNIRESFYGNGDYEKRERLIQNLLKESGGIRLEDDFPLMETEGFYPESKSGEIPLGYKNLSTFGNREQIRVGKPISFHKPESLDFGFFYLEGTWQVEEDHIVCKAPGCWIGVKNSSNGFNAVAGSRVSHLLPGETSLNGAPLSKEEAARDSVLKDGKSFFDVDAYRLYRLIKLENPSPMFVEIRFAEPGAELYALSFGRILDIRKRAGEGAQEGAPPSEPGKEEDAEKQQFELTTTFEKGSQ